MIVTVTAFPCSLKSCLMLWFLWRLSSQVIELHRFGPGSARSRGKSGDGGAAFWGFDCSLKDLLCPKKQALGASGSLERG
jgi:hypothetical protein